MQRWLFVPLVLTFSCRASVSANANMGGADDNDVSGLSTNEGTLAPEPSEPAMLGARHDLKLSPNQSQPRCSCLAVAVGKPADAAFSWLNETPSIDPQSQLVIALSSEGISCQGEPSDSLGASYWGYRVSGDDVIVFVENAKFGRPITTGAIIPRPLGSGQVFIQPASRKVPYGRALGNTGNECAVGGNQ